MLTSRILKCTLGNNTLKEHLGNGDRKEIDELDFVNRQMQFEDVPVQAEESDWSALRSSRL